MIPGLGDLTEEYRFLAPRLVAAGYRAVAMDIRGHGNSLTCWPSYTSAALGSDIVALVRDLEAGPTTVIGTSMGAGATAWAAAEAPDAIRHLVPIGPFVREVPVASWFVMIDGAGHYPHAEMRAITAPVVLDLLATGAAAS